MMTRWQKYELIALDEVRLRAAGRQRRGISVPGDLERAERAALIVTINLSALARRDAGLLCKSDPGSL
jgi:hypothetical protein